LLLLNCNLIVAVTASVTFATWPNELFHGMMIPHWVLVNLTLVLLYMGLTIYCQSNIDHFEVMNLDGLPYSRRTPTNSPTFDSSSQPFLDRFSRHTVIGIHVFCFE
jgi:hypothetical protein